METWKKMWVGVFFWTQCSFQLVANFFTILIALLVIYLNFSACLELFLTSIGKWNLINVIEFIINYGEFRLHEFPLKQIRTLMYMILSEVKYRCRMVLPHSSFLSDEQFASFYSKFQ